MERMRAYEAAGHVNGMVFKPGWRVYAAVKDEATIVVGFRIDTVDTSYPDAATGDCRQRITLGPDTEVDVTGLDFEGLCYQVIRFADELDSHENREFLKVRRPDGSWYAPLHPHTAKGNRAWARNQAEDTDTELGRVLARLERELAR